MGPSHVQFVPDVLLGVVRLREDVHTLRSAVPVVSGAREVQVGVPQFEVVVLRRPELNVGRGAQHVLPGLDVHITHMDVVCREEVFERICRRASTACRHVTVGASVA